MCLAQLASSSTDAHLRFGASPSSASSSMLSPSSQDAMLRVWRISGEELATLTQEELSDVAALKLHLRKLHGLPVCIQELVHRSTVLQDAAVLEVPLELQLLLKPSPVQRHVVKELVYAASSGLTEVARLLLRAGANKDLAHRDGRTPLMCASEKGHLQIARLLLEAGAEKNATDRGSLTALMLASLRGHVELVRLLLEAGAEKDLRTCAGHTALMLASASGHVEIARLLVEVGADKDMADKGGITALMFASMAGHAEVAQLLTKAGADKDGLGFRV